MDKLIDYLLEFFAPEVEEVKQAALPIIGERQLLEIAVRNFELKKNGGKRSRV